MTWTFIQKCPNILDAYHVYVYKSSNFSEPETGVHQNVHSNTKGHSIKSNPIGLKIFTIYFECTICFAIPWLHNRCTIPHTKHLLIILSVFFVRRREKLFFSVVMVTQIPHPFYVFSSRLSWLRIPTYKNNTKGSSA